MDMTDSRIHPDHIAAFLLIAMAIMGLYANRQLLEYIFSEFSANTIELLLRTILATIGAAILLLTKHEGVIKTLIVTATVFALISLDSAVTDLVIVGEYYKYDFENFFRGVFMLVLGVILLANVIIYWMKASTNLNIMFYSMGCIMFLDIVRILIYYRNGDDFIDLFDSIVTKIPDFALMIFTMMLIRSDTVKVNTAMYDIREFSNEIKEMIVPTGVVMDRAEIPRLIDIADNGMGCDSYTIHLGSFNPIDYRMVLTKKDDGTLLQLYPSDNDTGIAMVRFMMDGVCIDTDDVSTCDTVRIYDDDSFFIQLIVRDSTGDSCSGLGS